MALVFVALFGSGCCIGVLGVGDCDEDMVSVDSLVWSAWRNPESFDAWLAGQTVDRDAAPCLRSISDDALTAWQAKLLECGQILSGSPAWELCHEEAEGLHNRGVVMSDLARTVEGTTRFAATSGGSFLIQSKGGLGTADWNALVDSLDASVEPFECER